MTTSTFERLATQTSVEVIRDVAELGCLREAWRRLHNKTRNATFFQTSDWIECVWTHCDSEVDTQVYVARRGEEVIGIVPLSICRETTRLGKIATLGFPLQDWGPSFDQIGALPAETWEAVLRQLHSERHQWKVLDLRWIERDSVPAIRDACDEHGIRYDCTPWQTCYAIVFDKDWDSYQAELKSKFRSDVRRNEKRLNKLGDVSYERYRPLGSQLGDDEPRWDLYEEIFRVAQLSWQSSADNGNTMSSASVADFLRQCHRRATSLGMVDLCVLRLDGEAIAFAYNYVCRGRIDALRFGFDPEYRDVRPGIALINWMIRDSFARGDAALHLGARGYGYKHRWANHAYTTSRVTEYARFDLRAQLLRWKRQWTERREL